MKRSTACKSKAGSKSKSSGASSSSGSTRCDSGSPAPSESESRKVVCGNYDLSCLPKNWDDDMNIRERMRSGLSLVVRLDPTTEKPVNGTVESTTENVKLNEPVLLPVCRLMKDNELKPPRLERIIEQINCFYNMAKIWGGYEAYYHQAWAIRRLMGKLKTFTYREFPPEDRVLCSWESF